MKLSELFQVLSVGELSLIRVGNDGQGIRTQDYPKVIAQVNAGLTDLHARFPLLEREVIIQQYDQISKYYLRSEYLESNKTSTQPIKYLIDTPDEPFLDDVIRVESVYDECGCPLYLDNEPACSSIMTPAFDCIQIVSPVGTNALFITYRANHPDIDINSTNLDVEIRIPASHEKALRYYIASQFYANSPNQETAAKGMEWTQRYEAECQRIEDLDLNNAYIGQTNVKPETRGWV
jgi:hypothetical protein